MGDLFNPGTIVGILGIIASGICTVLVIDRKTMREGMDDLRKRVGDLESERDDLLRKNADLKNDVSVCRTDLEALSKVVTGETHWVAIEVLIRDLIERFVKMSERLEIMFHQKGQP